MKKIFKRLLIVLAVLIVAVIVYVWIFFLPVMMGMAAKTVCSCVYVANRDLESVKEKELQVFPGLSSANIELTSDKSVIASMLGRSQKAIYREGLGCTLLAERTEEEVRKQKFSVASVPIINQDTIAWPNGN